MDHSEHKIIYFGSILPNLKKIAEERNNFESKKEQLKNELEI
jgi:hypothetical protein